MAMSDVNWEGLLLGAAIATAIVACSTTTGFLPLMAGLGGWSLGIALVTGAVLGHFTHEALQKTGVVQGKTP